MNNNFLVYEKRKIMSLLGICICMLMIVILCPNYNRESKSISKINTNIPNTYLTNSEAKVSDGYIYLSDIPYVKEQSKSGWGSIHLNEVDSGSNFSVKIEGAFYNFEKGIWAHASSTVVYDLSNYQDYSYFTTYTGVNSSSGNKGNGVKFYIYTSVDGKNWDLKTDSNPSAIKSSDDANFVKISIKDAKYLKLVADDNGANGNDHSVYVDAKLVKESYKDETELLVPNISDYDKKIKTEYANATLTNKDYELTLLQREFINNVGPYALKKFLAESEENKNTYLWLINDLDNLRLYVLGGTPDGGSYYNSLTVLSKLYNAKYEEISKDETGKYIYTQNNPNKNLKDDFSNAELTNNKWYPNLTKGDVYKKMAISLSLTHSTAVGYWAQINHPSNRSDALERYRIFKYLYDNGKFVVSDRQDQTDWFEALQVEEMRYIMNSIVDNEEIIWFNEYTQKRIDAHPNQEEKYLQPHTYIAYVWPNFANPIYHDPNNYDYFDELFEGIFTKYGVTYSSEGDIVYKAWMSMRNKYGTGAVCGGISKLGTHIRAAHGTPASVISQPGHAAIIYYRKLEDGRGYWTIDNDVSGWAQSGKTERLSIRMPLGWGNDSYVSGYAATYIVLAQEALNDYENYEKSEEIIMLANLYKGNSSKQEQIYRQALKTQSINIDAWYGLINLYLSDTSKTEKDYYNLAEELAESLKDFPLPMYNLTNLIKPKLTSSEYIFKFTLLQTRILTEGSNSTSTNVIQPSITKTVSKYLLGQIDTSLASFSFDGDNAGKIVLSSRFDGAGVRLDYSLDGKKTWNEVSFSAEEEHKITLTKKQIESITSENDIYVHIVGTDYDESNLYKIDILQQAAPTNVYNNDLENKVMGATDNMEWRMDGSNTWTLFKNSEPDLTGDKTVFVRNKSTGVYLTSDEVTLKYTTDVIDEKRKYIPVSNLSIEAVSSESDAQDRYAKYAIDGNINTSWHSAWDGSDTSKYIVIKVAKPIYLSALEYNPITGVNGRVLNAQVLVSMDAENWTEIMPETKWANDTTKKTIDLDESIRAKYIKIVGKETTTNANGKSFMTAAMISLFEDTTKQYIPVVDIEYDIKSLTNKDVTAKIINPSTDIKITNNNGKDSYVFKENGKFTFEFVDASGNVGNVVAIVSNIDKVLPTATIEYSSKEETNKPVIATLTNESEPITILNNDGKKEYTFNKNGTFEFAYKDNAGNVNKTTAKVDWIISNSNEDNLENPDKIIDDNNTNDSNQTPSDNNNESSEKKDDNTNESGDSNATTNDNNSNIVVDVVLDEKTSTPSNASTNENNSTYNNTNLNTSINNYNNAQVVQNTIDASTEEIKFETYSVGAVTIQIPSNVITEKTQLKSKKLKLSKELQKMINEENEYFEIYFENENSDKINIDSTSIKMTIKINSSKNLIGIYEVTEDNNLKQLDYNELSDNEIELEINSLGKYVISYEKEDITIEPKNKETKNINFIIIGSVIIIGLVFIMILRKYIKK